MTDAPVPDDSWMPDPANFPANVRPIDPRKPSRAVLRDELAGAPEVPPPPGGAAPPPDDGPPQDEAPPRDQEPDAPAPPRGGKPDRPRGEIWDGCPVKPLGVNGATYYYLDVHGQLRAVAKHDAQSILMLFGRLIPQLCYHFAQWTKDPDTGDMRRKEGRFDQTTAAMDMIQACSERGLFDPEGAVRGVGAWSDDDGQLVYHTGDSLIIGGRAQPPDTHHGRIYPAYPPIPHPAVAGKPGADPVGPLIEALETWRWTRADMDPFLTLGLIGVQMLGGALDWRPAYWITGGPGTGKSALQRLMLHLHGGEKGLIQSTDPTARGIASQLQHSTLPVSLDELEPGDAGSPKEKQIIVTARVAASGGRWLRGSSDQRGASGQLRSTFLFSSVLIPGVLKSQDLQRIIVLSLDRFADGQTPPDLRAETWRKRGAAIKRTLIDRWPSWRTRLELWREACAAEGVTGRDADNWATTLAMAQMMMAEALPAEDELTSWARKIAKAVRAQDGGRGGDHEEMLTWLLSKEYDVHRRGERFTVAQWVQVAAGSPGAPPQLLGDFAQDVIGRKDRAEAANRALAKAMLRVVADGRDPPHLFIGNAHVATLLALFEGSQWAGGAWSQSAARVPNARPSVNVRTLAGQRSRGWEIPLASIPGIMDGPIETPVSSQPAAPAQAPHIEDFA